MQILRYETYKQNVANTEKATQTIQQNLDEQVLDIIRAVQKRGDEAALVYTKKFDKADVTSLSVSEEEWNNAFNSIKTEQPALFEALTAAAENIRQYQQKTKEEGFQFSPQPGIQLGQKITPLDRVGVYVPGGKASYPSTVLMDVIPAVVAGVEQVVITTPPRPDGSLDPAVLTAAKIAGATGVYKIGGAQAVAALAYGTESLPKVDKIVGPGNAFVARAKKWVFGDVAIDMIAGPSEICAFADNTVPPSYVAADLLSQAEHAEDATSICVTTDADYAEEVQKEVERQIPLLERAAIIRESIQANGKIIICDDEDQAMELINSIAPEHLQLMGAGAEKQVEKVKHAGAIFIGPYSSEPLGDYFAGPNHTLPTNGTARFSSPLGVYDFMKKSSTIHYSKERLLDYADTIITIAEAEGLTAHANAIRIRKENNDASS
ncbi:histidinol dehydrogenase [Oceanobacillus neutriphilus]|uniref:Histidinol dehydrogenase n=1 Tax=Oceanobacillus neutriphilus TaxID=531815 RepID=A0ABQ2P059_9BACI|nr:histidinol dehydrogenase [Oceanobacillus neutriphilus]GGP14935.1 histidinol dehydrogenase [Oceanobacillus neutriphilus]